MALITQEQIDQMTDDEKLELLDMANDAYRNSGELILTDQLYDKLEKELGLENKNKVGNTSGKYTVKHSFVMGSLAKVHILEKPDGSINYNEAAQEITHYLNKSDGTLTYETTPKLDGCSFSAEFMNVGGRAELVSCATRGDTAYGADMSKFFEFALNSSYFSKIDEAVTALCDEASDDIFCIRGEMLIPIDTFNSYTCKKVNPRSMVSGITGTDWNESEDFISKVKDLHWVCYDYRIVHNGIYTELSWMNPSDHTYEKLKPFLGCIGELPDKKWCQVHQYNGRITVDELKEIYADYDNYRTNICNYALDGIVFKPSASTRVYDPTRQRPTDCLAVKYLPMKASTEIIDIEWTTGKTNEYAATAIIKTVILDGKNVNRAKVGSYKIMKNEGLGIGAKIVVALSGDIIPDIIEVVEPVPFSDKNMNIPEDAYEQDHQNSGTPHLYRDIQGEDLLLHKFQASADALDIPSIGPAARKELWVALHNDIDELDNIIKLMNDDAYDLIIKRMGNSKSVQTYVTNIKAYRESMTLTQLIMSFCFPSCGKTASEICAKIMSGLPYTTSGSSLGYNWALNNGSREYYLVSTAMEELGIEPLSVDDSGINQVPVILTGEPTDGSTKAKWLSKHPQYVMTTKWAECKILFTNDMNSTTGKMKKASDINAKGKQFIIVKPYDAADDPNDKDLQQLGCAGSGINEGRLSNKIANIITDEISNNGLF